MGLFKKHSGQVEVLAMLPLILAVFPKRFQQHTSLTNLKTR